jgi:hypothetical protein
MSKLISLSERRTALRRRIGLPGLIEREGQKPLRCRLVDITRHGACVSACAIVLPNVFVLKGASATRHVCEVVWRKDYTVGVRFVGIDQLLARTVRATAKLKRSCARVAGRDAAEEAG